MKKILMLVLFIWITLDSLQAQQLDSIYSIPKNMRAYTNIRLTKNPYILPIAKTAIRGSYPVELAFEKTTHIIFPSRIIDFDAGSDVVIATVPEPVQNILRVKSDVKGFYNETNMTVITEDGGLYSFLVCYNDNPEVFTLNISNNIIADENTTRELGIGLSSNSSPNVYILGSGIVNEEKIKKECLLVSDAKNYIKHIGAKKDYLFVNLNAIYRADDLLFLKFEFKNNSFMPFTVDFIKLFVRDKNQVKRTAAQEEEITPVGTYPIDNQTMSYTSKLTKVVAIPQFTLSDGKILEVEIYEKKGGRHLKFQVDNQTLLRVKHL